MPFTAIPTGTASRAVAILALTLLSSGAVGEPPSESTPDNAPATVPSKSTPGASSTPTPAQGSTPTSSPGSTAPAQPASHTTQPSSSAPTTSPLLVPEPAWSPRPPRAPAVPPVARPTAAGNTTSPATDPAQFAADAKWDLAGYNNDEVIYTIFITSRDPRIIRCTALLNGFFYENGEKHSVSDRQSTTVFPQQRVQAGNWQGMDKESGVNYSVKCHPV